MGLRGFRRALTVRGLWAGARESSTPAVVAAGSTHYPGRMVDPADAAPEPESAPESAAASGAALDRPPVAASSSGAAAAPSATEAPAAAPAGRPRRTWDLVLTIVLLLLSFAGALVLSFLALFLLAFGSDSCVVRECNYDIISTGMMIGLVGPWIPVVLALIVSIVLLVLRRIAFWVPIVGAVLSLGALILGFVVAGTGVAPA